MDHQQQHATSQGLGQGNPMQSQQSGSTAVLPQLGTNAQAPPLPAHIMNFISNPALAAAAAASPHFPPPPAMLNNPGAFLLPGMFPNNGNNVQHANGVPVVNGNPQANMPNNGSADNTGNAQTGLTPVLPMFMGSMTNNANTNNSTQSTLGGIPIPSMPPQTSTAMQVQVAAAAAAAAAAPLKSGKGPTHQNSDGRSGQEGLTPEEKAKQNRERNREHARSTRLRKKAYVQKLKELVEGLHAERTEELRKRRVAIQHLADVQNVRRSVVQSFLSNLVNYESDPRKWMTILEDNFWFKQPVTPYRSFRRAEIEQDCRVSRGIEAVIADASSLHTMVQGVGSRSARWMQVKRHEALQQAEVRTGSGQMPHSIVQDSSRLQHAVSSLSSSSGSSHGSGGEEDRKRRHGIISQNGPIANAADLNKTDAGGAKKVSASSSGSESLKQKPSRDFHDYNAPSLPDPMLADSESSSPGEDSPTEGIDGGKQISTDEEDEDKPTDTAAGPTKRRKTSDFEGVGDTPMQTFARPVDVSVASRPPRGELSGLPPNIAKSGGITHSVRPASKNPRLSAAPAISLPPFAGIGKRNVIPQAATAVTVGAVRTSGSDNAPIKPAQNTVGAQKQEPATVSVSKTHNLAVASTNGDVQPGPSVTQGPAVIAADVESSTSGSSNQQSQIRAYYHVNEDDMLLTEEVLMCPFIFRTQDAVLLGALAECIMPGMLRAHFSARNKLMSLEMVYDAMGFMQQLERASGSDGSAQIVPGSLEMALAPNSSEARAITLAQPPFLIVSVNEAWTGVTKYTQMEVEGKDLSILNGKRTNPDAANLSRAFEEVSKGRSMCSTIVHYDKDGKEFIDFMCSYPLTNANDEITHILHVCRELPEPSSPSYEFQGSNSNGSANGSDNQTSNGSANGSDNQT